MATTDPTTGETPEPDFRYRHLCDITSGLGSLWRRRLYTDLTLVIEGKYVKCHRVVLASASPYFHTRLYNGKRDNPADLLFVHDVARDIMVDVLDFIYTGECRVGDENAEDLLRVATLFQMVTLKDKCDFFLQEKVHLGNAIRWYKMASATKSQETEKTARRVIADNLRQLWPTRLFMQLSLRELVAIISEGNDLVKTSSEDVLLDAALAWVKADMGSRKGLLGEILDHISLYKVPEGTLREVLEEEEVVKEDRRSSEKIQEVLRQREISAARHQEKASAAITPCPSFRPHQETKLDDVLVLVGGVESQDRRFKTSQQVHAFNLPLRKWFPLAPLPQGCDSGAACCLHGQDIFVCGTGDSRQGLVRYDSDHNCWTLLAPMVVGRKGHSVAATGSHLYVIGGLAENDAATHSPRSPRPLATAVVECYDILRNVWHVAGALAEPVSGASAVVLDDKVHVFGGFQGKDRPTSLVQTFDPASASCRVTSQLPHPVALSRAMVSEGRVIILGPPGTVVTTSDCLTFRVVTSIPDFKRALFGMALHGNRLFVAGGRYGKRVYDDVLMVDFEHATLMKLPEPLPLPVWGGGFLKISLDRAHMVKPGSEASEY